VTGTYFVVVGNCRHKRSPSLGKCAGLQRN
jgi:hypothetical protein